MPRTRIKICGITTIEDAFAAVDAGADAVGFVHTPASPRHITIEQAREIAGALPPFVARVGLFVNAKPAQVEQAIIDNPFMDTVQLHGREAEPTVREIAHFGIDVIKAIRFDPGTIASDLRKWSVIDELVAVLVDGSSGGQGTALDWDAFAAHINDSDHPVILAGGLSPVNVAHAIRTVEPYAVDVSSGVEFPHAADEDSGPRRKDPARLRAFCEAVRDADATLM